MASCDPDSTVATQTDGSDLLKAPFGPCQFYVGDSVAVSSKVSSPPKRSIDMLTRVYPTKGAARAPIIQAGSGFVNRFQAFVNNYLNTPLIGPLVAVAGDPKAANGLNAQLQKIYAGDAQLRSTLDSRDSQMVQAVSNAWQQDQKLLTQAATSAASLLKTAETQGASMVNAEMKQMYNTATKAVSSNEKTIAALAKAQILQANSTAQSIMKLAQQMWANSNGTLDKADQLYKNMNATEDKLNSAIAALAGNLARIANSMSVSGSNMFLNGQNQSNTAQLSASSSVDQTLQKMAQDVANSLTALTSAENQNLTAISANTQQSVSQLASSVTKALSDATAQANALAATYQKNVTQTMNNVNSVFSLAGQQVTSLGNKVNANNNSLASLQSYMTTQFSDLDNQMTATFANITQQAQLQQSSLGASMDTTLNTYKQLALNATTAGSQQLSNAFNSVMSAVTSGSGSLSLTYQQQQQLVAALQGWQQNYQGDANDLVNSFTNTYTGLVSDTSSQLASAVSQQNAQIAAANANQAQMMQQAVAAAQGDPTKLGQILAQFGLVGNRAAAAAQQVQAQLLAANSSTANGLGDGMTALNLLLQAADANSAVYAQAGAQTQQAASTAQNAVKNVTARIGTMNQLMQQYGAQLQQFLFNSSLSATQQINSATSGANSDVTSTVNAQMLSVQSMLSSVLTQGGGNAQNLAAFAAQVGANATALGNLVSALQSGSTGLLSQITGASQDAIGSIQTQVAAQLDASQASFSSSVDAEKASIMQLVQGMQNDLSSQSGLKSSTLLQQGNVLQGMLAQMTAAGVQRNQLAQQLTQQFTTNQNQANSALAEYTAKVAAQEQQVNASFASAESQLQSAEASVEESVNDANTSAAQALSGLQAQGAQQVAGVQATLTDVSNAVSMIVDRYEAVVAKYLDQDQTQRIAESSNELASMMGVNTTLFNSQQAQAAALAARRVQSQNRASALAAMVGDLSGANQAASQGQSAFMAYVQALAQETGTNMVDLVAAMQSQVTDQKSSLYKLLQSNGLFVSGTLSQLAQSAALLQQGVIDGSGDVLANVQASMQGANALAANSAAKMGSLTNQANNASAITGQQLQQLMTILLAQSAVQNNAAYQSNQAAMTQTATMNDALSISLQAMNEATNATQDALSVASGVTDSVAANATALVDDSVESAQAQASGYSDAASAKYDQVMQAVNQASSFLSVFNSRLQGIQTVWDNNKGNVESQIAAVQSDIANIDATAIANKQSEIDRINQWAGQVESQSLTALAAIQAKAAAAGTTTAAR